MVVESWFENVKDMPPVYDPERNLHLLERGISVQGQDPMLVFESFGNLFHVESSIHLCQMVGVSLVMVVHYGQLIRDPYVEQTIENVPKIHVGPI